MTLRFAPKIFEAGLADLVTETEKKSPSCIACLLTFASMTMSATLVSSPQGWWYLALFKESHSKHFIYSHQAFTGQLLRLNQCSVSSLPCLTFFIMTVLKIFEGVISNMYYFGKESLQAKTETSLYVKFQFSIHICLK